MAAKKTLEGLASEVGSDKGTLSAYENGVHLPRLDCLERLADALGVKLDAFAEDRRHPRRVPAGEAPTQISNEKSAASGAKR